jgi:hypothetical protein
VNLEGVVRRQEDETHRDEQPESRPAFRRSGAAGGENPEGKERRGKKLQTRNGGRPSAFTEIAARIPRANEPVSHCREYEQEIQGKAEGEDASRAGHFVSKR